MLIMITEFKDIFHVQIGRLCDDITYLQSPFFMVLGSGTMETVVKKGLTYGDVLGEFKEI